MHACLIVPLSIILLTDEETYLLQPTLPEELEIAYSPSINPIMTVQPRAHASFKNWMRVGWKGSWEFDVRGGGGDGGDGVCTLAS